MGKKHGRVVTIGEGNKMTFDPGASCKTEKICRKKAKPPLLYFE